MKLSEIKRQGEAIKMQETVIEKGMIVRLITGGPAMSVSRKNSSDLWICHWFSKNVRREGYFTEEELTGIANEKEDNIASESIEALEQSIKDSEALLVNHMPEYFKRILQIVDAGLSLNEAQENESTVLGNDASSDTETESIEKGQTVWLQSGSPAMTVSRKNSLEQWICHYFEKDMLHEDYYVEEELTEWNPKGKTREESDQEFAEEMYLRIKGDPERFRSLIREAEDERMSEEKI